MKPSFEELLKPICQEMGVDILAVKLHGSGSSRKTLRVTIDGVGGISSVVLESVSRALSLQLDAYDNVDDAYMLEVSSPGLNWPLETEDDFRRHMNELLQVNMEDGQSFTGECHEVNDGFISLQNVKGKSHQLAIESIVKAVRIVDWKKKNKEKKVFS
ncbi:MAG: hypothetical protein Q9M28_08405 [Mariprofundaceae bacterium]|nr:hypothetical protein [Mariprofundaceae bacterium]